MEAQHTDSATGLNINENDEKEMLLYTASQKNLKGETKKPAAFKDVYIIQPFHTYVVVPSKLMWTKLKKNWILVVFIILTILGGVGQNVYLKILGNKMPDFSYFIFWFTAIFFVPPFFIWVAVVMIFTKQITPEMRTLSLQVKFAIMGFLIMLNGVFILFANPHVPGLMQALLGPSVVTIPLAMIASFLMLKRKYSLFQVGAVGVILLGLLVAIAPSIIQAFQPAPSGPSSGDACEASGSAATFGNIWWNLMFLAGSLPITIAYVYEEKVLSAQEIHISWLVAWSTLYQLFSILLSFPLDGIPGFGDTTFNDLFSHQYYGLVCLADKELPSGVCDCCDCKLSWAYMLVFIVCYEVSTFAAVGVVKYGNATFSFIIQAITLPLTEFAFSSKFLMRSYVEELAWENYVSLVFLLIGIILYRVFDKETNSIDPEAGIDMETTKTATMGKADPTKVESLGVSVGIAYLSIPAHLFPKERDIQSLVAPRSGEAPDHWTLP